MRGQRAAKVRPMRGGRGSARRAPELVSGRRDVPGVLQDMLGLSRSTSSPRTSAGTRREHAEGQGDQQSWLIKGTPEMWLPAKPEMCGREVTGCLPCDLEILEITGAQAAQLVKGQTRDVIGRSHAACCVMALLGFFWCSYLLWCF